MSLREMRIHMKVRRFLKSAGYFKNKMLRAARLTDPLVNKKISDIMSLILELFLQFSRYV